MSGNDDRPDEGVDDSQREGMAPQAERTHPVAPEGLRTSSAEGPEATEDAGGNEAAQAKRPTPEALLRTDA